MNGILVGKLIKSTSGSLTYAYESDWVETKGARPISLSMPLSSRLYSGEIPYNYFDNLLPDNTNIRDRIQTRFKASTSHPFDLLSEIGMDCVGALQIAPQEQNLDDVKCINSVPLTDSQISRLLKSYHTAPLGMSEDDGENFRISIAGAQEKTALLLKDGAWHRPLGATPTTHIFKLPIGKIEHSGMDLNQSCENEWLCLKIAAAFGFSVCDSEIMTFEDTKVLVVKRFDRRYGKGWIMRLPQEDMCQVLGVSPNLKYESDGGPGIDAIMRFLLHSQSAKQDRESFFKSQVLFYLLAGIDGHAKNFSVFIESEGRYRMTPLYDIMSAHPLISAKQLQIQKIKMAMALSGKNRHYLWHTIQPRHFISTARHVGFNEKTAQAAIREMMDSLEGVIATVEQQIPDDFPDDVSIPILTGMRQQRERFLALGGLNQ